jgi:branched-chain amino acid transport system ATP-binding protein
VQSKELSMAALEVSEVWMAFGGAQVLTDVSISVPTGSVTGLIGPNGAGKTTLFNIVSGLLAPKSGRILIDGRDVTKAGPAARARRGLARTYQRLELFTSLTVRDNIRVAGEIRNTWGRRGRIAVETETDRAIELVGLGDVANREVSELPTARARVVEVARALMTQPKVLLLDEPASGQTEQETEAFGRLLRQLVEERDLAICLVEHDVSLVMGTCESIHVLDYGEIIASGTSDQIKNDPAVVDAYLGAP